MDTSISNYHELSTTIYFSESPSFDPPFERDVWDSENGRKRKKKKRKEHITYFISGLYSMELRLSVDLSDSWT